MKPSGYFFNSLIWGTLSKVVDAIAKFTTLPMLIMHFGKSDYGLLTLALSANAYLLILDLGVNTGGIKYFSQWIGSGDRERVSQVAKASLAFYGWIGLANAIVLAILAGLADFIFKIDHDQVDSLRAMLLMLSGFSIFNWFSSVSNQLLTANHEISIIHQATLVKSVLILFLAVAALYYHFSLEIYFAFFCLLNTGIALPLLVICKKRGLLDSFVPRWNWTAFEPIFRYSMGIFAMGVFQFTASASRPIVLGIFSKNGTADLADYRVMEVFPLFILSIGGMILSTLLPESSQAIQSNNKEKILRILFQGTRFVTLFACGLAFPIFVAREPLLEVYVGRDFSSLGIWMGLWSLSVVITMHAYPASSVILAMGKTRLLVYSSAFSCLVSIVLNAVLCSHLGAASAVVGYLSYVVLQVIISYIIIIPKVLLVPSLKILSNASVPVLLSILVSLPFMLPFWSGIPVKIRLFLMVAGWSTIYLTVIAAFYRKDFLKYSQEHMKNAKLTKVIRFALIAK